ncbi:MAG: hypothetical protein KF851_02855 [Pirellulaceae bacterium]|nr:hypothetical protein [Pirellulaceae bacterium]
MDLFVAIFIVSGFAVLWLLSLLVRQRERQQIKSICSIQEQRLVGQISERHLDPDFRRVCRAVAVVASEALGQSNMKIDSERLAPGDTLYGNLGMSLDSLSHVNLTCEL